MVIPDLSLYLAFMDLVTQVVCAVIRNHRGAYLATQRDSGSFEGLWEFPGGKHEPGESIETCIERELKEELGIVISVGEELITLDHAYSHKKLRPENDSTGADDPPPA